jgi:imidazolonepropionase-like amidohydrolase
VSRAFVMRGANVLDESGIFTGPLDVAVEDGRIAAVERDAAAAPGATSVDCSDLWLMPGVFDCHDHLTFSSLDPLELMSTPITRWTLEASRNLSRTLECGVTFVRDAAGADAGIRDSVERGFVAGPRIQTSVVALCETGGHFDGFLVGPGSERSADYVLPDYPGRPPFVVDGVDDVRRAVRHVLRAGADWIKVCATGGIASPFDDGDLPQFTFEELAVAVEEAARKGKGVMAHAFGGRGLDDAVAAGVRSIEHGIFLTEEQAAAMAAAGTWLVPTLAILRDVLRWADEPGRMPDYHVHKVRAIEPRLGNAVRIAREHGVPMALGTDFVERCQHGRNLEELVLMHEAGLPAAETLLAATIRGAELCGVADTYGRIAPGYVFDAILLDEDPSDISVFGRRDAVTGVFKGGRMVFEHPRFTDALGARARPLVRPHESAMR